MIIRAVVWKRVYLILCSSKRSPGLLGRSLGSVEGRAIELLKKME
jgi:hypothetical protein